MFLCGAKDGVLNDFLGLKKDARDRLKLLAGHVDYGIHHNYQGNSKYIAFLRDPGERVVSHYYYQINITETTLTPKRWKLMNS